MQAVAARLRTALACWRSGELGALASLEHWALLSSRDDSLQEVESAAALVAPLRELCGALRDASTSDTRCCTGALAQLATEGSLALALLAPGGELLRTEVAEVCGMIFDRYTAFVAAWQQLHSAPSYAPPFDLGLAVAHCCALLGGLEEQILGGGEEGRLSLAAWPAAEPTLAPKLLALAQAPVVVEDASFDFLACSLQRRASALCASLARHIREVSDLEGCAETAKALQALETAGRLHASGESADAEPLSPHERRPVLGQAFSVDPHGDGSRATAKVLLSEGNRVLLRTEGSYSVVDWRMLLIVQEDEDEIEEHYAVLGLDQCASPEDVAGAFRRLAKQHHPDKGGDSATFQRIRAAFEALTVVAPPEAYSSESDRDQGGSVSADLSPASPSGCVSSSDHAHLDPSPSLPADCSPMPPAHRAAGTPDRDPEQQATAAPCTPILAAGAVAAAHCELTPDRPSTPSTRRRLRRKTAEDWHVGQFEQSSAEEKRALTPVRLSKQPAARKRRCPSQQDVPWMPPTKGVKRVRGLAPGPNGLAAHDVREAQGLPPHELTVNGLLQLIWTFAF